MKKILFVDDEALVLEAMQRMLHTMRSEWDMRFAASGEQALQMLAESPADVVISDMRMPQMNGAQLLNEVLRLHPKTVRLILSGYADMEMILQCINGTHQFLAKPCGGDMIKNVVRRALEMDAWVNNDQLKLLVSRLGALPSLPTLYFEIFRQLESPAADLDKIGAIIARDPAMTAKMLQLVNSAFFGLHRKLTAPGEAVLQLGLQTIKSLVLILHVFAELKTPESLQGPVQKLWHHSLATAATARRIAVAEQQEKNLVEECFTAGLLHDIGRLMLMSNLSEEYALVMQRAERENLSLVAAERAVLGTTHAEVGGYLLGLWGLPIALVETTVFHHWPSRCQKREFNTLTIVHAANILEQDPLAPGRDAATRQELDRAYLDELWMWDRAQAWEIFASRNQTSSAEKQPGAF
jgi:HD-like signal output (HDOD) protein